MPAYASFTPVSTWANCCDSPTRWNFQNTTTGGVDATRLGQLHWKPILACARSWACDLCACVQARGRRRGRVGVWGCGCVYVPSEKMQIFFPGFSLLWLVSGWAQRLEWFCSSRLVSISEGHCTGEKHCPPKALSVRGDMDSDQLHVPAISSWNRIWPTLRTRPLLKALFLQYADTLFATIWIFLSWSTGVKNISRWNLLFRINASFFLLPFLSCCFACKIHSNNPIRTVILFKRVRVCAFVFTRYLSSIAIEDSMSTYWFAARYWQSLVWASKLTIVKVHCLHQISQTNTGTWRVQ